MIYSLLELDKSHGHKKITVCTVFLTLKKVFQLGTKLNDISKMLVFSSCQDIAVHFHYLLTDY